MKGRVLVTSGDNHGSRAALAAVRALAAGGYRPSVTVSGSRSLAGASRYCERRVEVPPATSSPTAFAAAIRSELAAGSYLTVLPISEPVLLALDLPVSPLVSKVATVKAATAAGIPVPPTRVFASAQDLRDAADDLDYPIVIKQDIKTHLALRVDNPAALEAADIGAGVLVTQPFLKDALHGVVGLMWRGRLVSAVHMSYLRIWPIPCGTITAGETLPVDSELESGLERLLADHNGIFHADLAGPYLLDLNPRAHAALSLGVSAGVNVVAQYCDLLSGGAVAVSRAKPGVFYRWTEGDIRSVIHALRGGRTTAAGAIRALAPRPGTVYSVEDARDPWPLVERFLAIGIRATRSLRPRTEKLVNAHPPAPIGPGHAR